MFHLSLNPVVCRMAHECLVYAICVWLRKVMSNTCCIVFLFLSFHLVASFSGLSILIAPSVFSNVYIVWLPPLEVKFLQRNKEVTVSEIVTIYNINLRKKAKLFLESKINFSLNVISTCAIWTLVLCGDRNRFKIRPT